VSEDRLSTELQNLLGEPAFLALAEAFGGTRLFIPSTDRENQLLPILGRVAVDQLAGRYGRSYLRVPLAREARARHYRATGMSNAEIARKLGLTETGIDKMFRRMGTRPAKGSADPRQLFLFDD
jgi:DNA-binding NarL/FixJ family response regulator